MTTPAGEPTQRALPLHDHAVEIVRARLEADDPQTCGAEVKAGRIIDDLEEAGLLFYGRPIQALPLANVARHGL